MSKKPDPVATTVAIASRDQLITVAEHHLKAAMREADMAHSYFVAAGLRAKELSEAKQALQWALKSLKEDER